MIDFKFEQAGKVGMLTINDDLVVQKEDELREALMMSMAFADHVVINIDRVTEVDLSCLQFLCSAYLTSLRSNKVLSMVSPVPDVYKRAIQYAGYCKHTGCMNQSERSCLWDKPYIRPHGVQGSAYVKSVAVM
jgi:anti-anti-sigma regulatory factor